MVPSIRQTVSTAKSQQVCIAGGSSSNMDRSPQQRVYKAEKADVCADSFVTLGLHCLRARHNKVDYCELKDKPGQLYRPVYSSKVPRSKAKSSHRKRGNASKEAPKHALVDLPSKVEPWPVYIKLHDEGPHTYALWVNAADMMADPQVEGRFTICSSSTYAPVRNAKPVKSAQLCPQVGLLSEHSYRKRIKLGKAFQFPSGQTYKEGSPILTVLQHAWPSKAEPMKRRVGGTHLTPGSKVRRAKARASSKRTPPLPESGEPVRVHVTSQSTKHTVYGLWTNAQAAIESCQPGPLLFVQCEQHTYQPFSPEVKYRNDRFNMLTGLPTYGGWRKVVKLDQQLSVPGGPTFEIGTRLSQVFETLTRLKDEKVQSTRPAVPQDSKSEEGYRIEEASDKEGEHSVPKNDNVDITAEQQGTTPPCEVVVIDNSRKEKQTNDNNDGCRTTGNKCPASSPTSSSRPRKRGKKEQPQGTCNTNKESQGNNNYTNGRGLKRAAASEGAKSDENARKRNKEVQYGTSKAGLPQDGSVTSALQQPCSGPAADKSGRIPQSPRPEPSTKLPAVDLHVDMPVADIGPSSALQGPDKSQHQQQQQQQQQMTPVIDFDKQSTGTGPSMALQMPTAINTHNQQHQHQQHQHMAMTSLPPMSLDAQFNIDTDSALRVLTALNRLMRSLNYGGKQAKQLWDGFQNVFLGEGINRSTTYQKQEWAKKYLQLAGAVASENTEYVCSVLKDQFGIVP